jgi:microcystin-dependent protein
MDQPYLGAVFIWAGNFAPRGYAFCQGQILSIAQNQALFSILGTTYGGNGTTTFALPNLCGRAPFGAGVPAQGTGLTTLTLGEVGGHESTTLTQNNLPAHNHSATFTPTGGSQTPLSVTTNLSVSTETASTLTPNLVNGDTAYLANALAGGAGNALKGLYTKTAPATGNIATIPANTTVSGGTGGITGGTVAVGNTGSNMPFDNHPPYLALNFIIATEGLYPPRN